MSLKAGILASRLRFELHGWNLDLEARIWSSRLGFRPQDWDMSFHRGGQTEREKKEMRKGRGELRKKEREE